MRGNFLLVLPPSFHATIIEQASANNDKKTAKFAYIDILDYQNAGLTSDHLSIVFESFDYDVAIDHGLANHLGQTAVKLGVSNSSGLKMHQALYYYRIKGYLTAVDILKEISASNASGKIGKSETLKKFFFDSLFDAASQIDADVKT